MISDMGGFEVMNIEVRVSTRTTAFQQVDAEPADGV